MNNTPPTPPSPTDVEFDDFIDVETDDIDTDDFDTDDLVDEEAVDSDVVGGDVSGDEVVVVVGSGGDGGDGGDGGGDGVEGEDNEDNDEDPVEVFDEDMDEWIDMDTDEEPDEQRGEQHNEPVEQERDGEFDWELAFKRKLDRTELPMYPLALLTNSVRLPPPKDFVLHALQASGEEGALVRVAGFEVEVAGGLDERFISDIWRVRLTLEDAAGGRRVRYVIVKRQPEGNIRECFVRKSGMFAVEAAAYQQALPAMLKLLRRAYGDAFRPFWPRFIYASMDKGELVMEDLEQANFAPPPNRMGMDLEESKSCIRTMAQLHAASVAMYEENQPSVAPFLEPVFRPNTRSMLENIMRISVRQLALQLREWPDFAVYADRVAALEDTCWDLILLAIARDDQGFNVINHGDLWINNVLFRKSEGPLPNDPEVAFVDWQLATWTSPALDLLYFFYTSPHDDVRREHGDALLELYQRTLQQTMQALGVVARAPTLEDLRADLQKRFAFAIYPLIAELPNALAEPKDRLDVRSIKNGREARVNAYACQPYASIIRRVLPLFEMCGVL